MTNILGMPVYVSTFLKLINISGKIKTAPRFQDCLIYYIFIFLGLGFQAYLQLLQNFVAGKNKPTGHTIIIGMDINQTKGNSIPNKLMMNPVAHISHI